MKKFSFLVFFLPTLVFDLRSDDWRSSPYFNTKFLAQYNVVCEHLTKDEGLEEGFFLTEDTVPINYLWLKRPHARYTVICCCGFWPGRKEGLATFYALMPDDCNLLFFDARGHGKSGGHFLSRIWQYGSYEYKDVIGAVHFAAKRQRCPIILYGVCAGAFHATHALLQLQKRGMLHHALQIKGLIFDSGWSSIAAASRSAFASEVDTMVRRRCKNSPRLYVSVSAIAQGMVHALHTCIVRPVLYMRTSDTNLANKMSRFDIPVMYIHAQSDTYVRIEPVQKLAEQTKQATTWWINEPSKHACHHLKLKEQYREKMLSFIDRVL